MKSLNFWRSIFTMTVVEEESVSNLSVDVPQSGKVFLGSGYDVTFK